MRTIPFFDYQRLYKDLKNDYIRIIDEVASRGAFILQQDLSNLENNIANFLGSKYSIGVGNGTDGLEICLASLKEKRKGKIICSAHTMLATASAMIMNGFTPIPVDICDDGLIDPNSIKDHIDNETVGIMPTQLNGRVCKMDEILSIAGNNNLFVIEDAAQALGAKYKNKCAGTFGISGAISFYPAKTLGSLGDGGIIITNCDETFDKAYQLHEHGRDINGDVKSWGRNSRLDNLQAAILDWKLTFYNETIKRRREIARRYTNNLKHLNELLLPPAPDESEINFDVYQNYELCASRRDELQSFLKKKGVGTLIQWGGKALHQFDNLGLKGNLPRVEKFFLECIMIPMNQFISDDDVDYISEQICNFYK